MTLRDRNWRKGLFRLWLFLSVLWIVAVGFLCLYPATSRYIESLKAAHELQSLRTSISYAFLEVNETDRSAAKSEGDIFDELEAESRRKVQESHTGVTVAFEWYENRSPTAADLDEVFRAALGQREIISTKPSLSQRHGKDLSSTTDKELKRKAGSPQDFQPLWRVPFRHEKLSDNESALLSKLQRIGVLEKNLEFLKNSKQDFLFSIGMCVLPPIAVLILGIGLMWVFLGFAPRRKG